MHEFQCGDLIGYNSPDEGYIYARVIDVTEEELEIECLYDPRGPLKNNKSKYNIL